MSNREDYTPGAAFRAEVRKDGAIFLVMGVTFAALWVACTTTNRPPTAPAAGVDSAQPNVTQEQARLPASGATGKIDASAPVQERRRCVPNASGSDIGTKLQRLPGGRARLVTAVPSCWMSAECIERRGQSAPGDGDLSLDCKGLSCSCKWKPHPAASRPRKLHFKVDAPCAFEGGNRAEALLFEHCERLVPSGAHE
jgi:hypothetical protein